MTTLLFRVEGEDHGIDLATDTAPRTTEKLLSVLPLGTDVHCAKIAGSHIMCPVPFLARPEALADVHAMPAGAFFYWPERQYVELTYAPLQAETASVIPLGRLTGDLAWLEEFAERQRREQGTRTFPAELRLAGARVPATEGAPRCSSALGRIRDARRAAWRAEPAEVRELLARRGKMLPFGALHMAEGELRKLQELLWLVWRDGDMGAPQLAIARFAIEAAITRVGGFCHLSSTQSILAHGVAALEEDDASEVLEELILYAGRMAAWLDARMPWWAYNEATLASLEG
ncbi:hypothetical protein [Acuticoccus sp.]|uniref:hypothetical protein n=1 Tax=Acuticoccus sp. TaxID=1904378 RepID=UPI003B52E3B9